MKDLSTDTTQLRWNVTGSSLQEDDLPLWSAYTGQPVNMIGGWGWLQAVHPADRLHVHNTWTQSLLTKRLYELDLRLLHHTGIYGSFHLKCVPLRAGTQELTSWISWLTPKRQSTPGIEAMPTKSELYNLLFEQASLGMCYGSLDGYITGVNPLFTTIMGYSRDELLGMHFLEIIAPADREPCNQFYQQKLFGNPGVNTTERQGMRKDGSIIWCKITSTVVRSPEYGPQMYFALFEDITAKKTAEAETQRILAREQAARAEATKLLNQLKVIYKSMQEYIVTFDTNGILLYTNKFTRVLLRLGYKKHCSLYKLAEQQNIHNMHGQPIAREDLPITRILHGAVLSNSAAEDIVAHLPSGHALVFSVSGAPIRDKQKNIVGGVCVFRDVTKQRQKERDILEAFKTLSTLLEALMRIPEKVDRSNPHTLELAPVTVIGSHVVNLITQIMDCKYTSVSFIDPVTGYIDVIGSKGLSSPYDAITNAEAAHSTLTDYFDAQTVADLQADEVVLSDLTLQPFAQRSTFMAFALPHLLLAPMFLAGQMIGLFTLGREGDLSSYSTQDINLVKVIAKFTALLIERTNLLHDWAQSRTNELALQEANRHFDAFLSITTHELRTPLTTIKGNLQLATRRLDAAKRLLAVDNEPLLQKLDATQCLLKNAIVRADVQNRMVGHLLDASRIRANKLEMNVHRFSLSELVCTIINEMQPLYPEHSLLLQTPPDEDIFVIADEERIHEVIEIYIFNALTHTPEQKPVNIFLQKSHRTARFWVHDAGSGISPTDQSHIWEPFYSTKGQEVRYYSTHEDLSLGLYISKKIIAYHHGRVGVKSSPGQGSIFWFILPLSAIVDTDQPATPANNVPVG